MSFSATLHRCPQCGAPLSPASSNCGYCDSLVQVLGYAVPDLLQPHEPPHLGRVEVGEHSYWLLGLLAQGHRSQVYLARRAALQSELVVLKQGPLENEWRNLSLFRQCDSFLYEVLPAPVAQQQDVFVYGWKAGFVHTLRDVQRQYPRGVDPQTMVWMANRLLDQLARVHSLGFVHAGLEPDHVLVHGRDHGLLLCGWTRSRRGQPALDLAACLQLLQSLLGRERLGQSPWRELFPRLGKLKSAHEVQQELQRTARSLFGSPRYHPFHLK